MAPLIGRNLHRINLRLAKLTAWVEAFHFHADTDGPEQVIKALQVAKSLRAGVVFSGARTANAAGDQSEANVTGKPIALGGSEGREAATGRGGVLAVLEYLKFTNQADKKFTYALQGFGNVGYFFAKTMQERAALLGVPCVDASHLQRNAKGEIDLKAIAPVPQDKLAALALAGLWRR